MPYKSAEKRKDHAREYARERYRRIHPDVRKIKECNDATIRWFYKAMNSRSDFAEWVLRIHPVMVEIKRNV